MFVRAANAQQVDVRAAAQAPRIAVDSGDALRDHRSTSVKGERLFVPNDRAASLAVPHRSIPIVAGEEPPFYRSRPVILGAGEIAMCGFAYGLVAYLYKHHVDHLNVPIVSLTGGMILSLPIATHIAKGIDH